MAPDDDGSNWAPPMFKPEDALQGLKRELRALGLTERNGVFERRGTAIAKAAVDGAAGGVAAGVAIAAARVRRPSRSSPEWQPRTLGSAAQVRDFVNDLKKCLASWSDTDE